MTEVVKKKVGFALNPDAINREGRPRKSPEDILKQKTNRALRETELIALLRKLRPHQTKAIMTAVGIMDNDIAKDGDKIRSSALILSTYRGLLMDLYNNGDDDAEGKEIQESNPMPKFSLTMINGSKSEDNA